MTLSNCTVTANSAGDGGAGGGVFNLAYGRAMMTVSASTVSRNSADLGGGIYNRAFGGAADLGIVDSTFSDNSVGGFGGIGGGILSEAIHDNETSASLRITKRTFSGNFASDAGGGMYVFTRFPSNNASVQIFSSTFTGNSASNYAGGIVALSFGESATLEIGDTILNRGTSGENIYTPGGRVTSLGNNLSSDDAGGFLTNATDQINTNPLLGPLQDNGGPTFTHALLCGSPAIDKGKDFSGLTTDQRGLPRPFDRPQNTNAPDGDGTDIGAFETQQICPPHLSHFGVLTNQFGFNINAESNQLAVVEASTNLTTWSALATNTVGGVPLRFNDADSGSFSNRFYRARTE